MVGARGRARQGRTWGSSRRGSRAKSVKAAPRESAETQHERSWKKFNKSCFISSWGPYWLLSNLFHPQSLFFGKAEEREGGGA